MSTYVTHLTRDGTVNGDPANVMNVLFNILKQKRIIGSTTESGFIVGETPAVCFQDAPPTSLCQNVYYEQKFRQTVAGTKVRYLGVGLMFEKSLAYNKGARPVIYDRTADAKSLLPASAWWRIVNLDLSNSDAVVDWSHEREWRCPNEFSFEYDNVYVVLTKKSAYRRFMQMCSDDDDQIQHKIAGVIVLETLLR